ncbi:MAG TPA: hypothetical protein VMS31_16230 [Pyrinomonadaceae bacterium]|nr:hypothetical protein [Pyrinomonadaceae bacterium]
MSKEKVRPESSGETHSFGIGDVDFEQEILIAWSAGKTLGQIAQQTGLPIKLVNRSLKQLLKQLSAKTAEIVHGAAIAHERIAKEQEEIEQLKTETREMLARLSAA